MNQTECVQVLYIKNPDPRKNYTILNTKNILENTIILC